ncbi:MAG: LptA/OstA family protein [Steroidobacteraceae bacterium]
MALAAISAAAAHAQERSRLPIKVEARSMDLDYQANRLVYNEVTIVQGEIRIVAERAVASGADFEDSGWEFTGAVRITMPDSELQSDTARVRFAAGEVQSASVTGSPAQFEQRGQEQNAQGRANRIDYDLGRGTVEFAGDAWLSDGRTELTGATLVYSTANQRVISREQVVITINPREDEAAEPAETPKPPE